MLDLVANTSLVPSMRQSTEELWQFLRSDGLQWLEGRRGRFLMTVWQLCAGSSPVERMRRQSRKPKRVNPDDDKAYPAFANDVDPWKAYFAEIDALLDRRDRVLAGEPPLPKSRSPIWVRQKESAPGLEGAL
jgi:hypothetical protein